ncbi:MAG: adenylyltransferase/cytidyltransferase family protein [Bacteroides sp.]|nr:adenylyltransferase/cytidyltransferase family protein [Bacteroides sp.]
MKSHINTSDTKADLTETVNTKKYYAARGDGLSAEKLKSEASFKSYLNMLWDFAQRYCVIVAAKGSPCGSKYTSDISKAFMDIGFGTDLRGRDFCGYVGMIDSDRIVFEMLEPDVKKAINGSASLDTGDEVAVFSSGDNALEVNKGLISVNGREYSPNGRGLNFVVYDKVTKTVIDAVSFDTSGDLSSFRADDYAKRFKEFEQRHPDVTVLGFNVMHFPYKHPTPIEQTILQRGLVYHKLMNELESCRFVLNKYFEDEAIPQVLEIPSSYRDLYGVIRFSDKSGKYVNIVDGHRITAYQPDDGGNINVYICGICLSFGLGTDDSRTVASYLQMLFNERLPDRKVTVHNYGSFLENVDETKEVLKLIENLPVKAGDVILWNADSHVINRANVPMIDIYDFAEKSHSEDYFFDMYHYTPSGYRIVAQRLYEELTDRGAVNGKLPVDMQSSCGFTRTLSEELEQYKSILRKYYDEMFTPAVGAVVMNCNPFTLGHRYLIEKALEMCDFLIIFVVEEDKSDIPFEDRLRLVDAGVKDISNAAVIPGGKFVISSLTFSEYFNKREMQDRTIDASLDVSVFAREIAPCLHIAKRFAGSEPFDSVTRQYNNSMRRILPEYGIEFIEIPRAETNGEPISASKVREMLENGDLEGIRQLVPDATFEYLSELLEKNR